MNCPVYKKNRTAASPVLMDKILLVIETECTEHIYFHSENIKFLPGTKNWIIKKVILFLRAKIFATMKPIYPTGSDVYLDDYNGSDLLNWFRFN